MSIKVRTTLSAALIAAQMLTACGGGGGGGGSAPSPAPAPTPAPSPAPPPAPAAKAPTIAQAPVDTQASDGGTASFTVAATGDAPLTYQWFRDGQPLSGATSASYTTPALALADGGSQFTVAVSNATGTVTSIAAKLTVKANPPTLLSQPRSQTVDDGKSAIFSIAAGGSQTLSFQWSRNGQPILGATSSSYELSKVDMADDGSRYSIKVSNSAGEKSSDVAVLTVKPVPLQITSSPAAVTMADGGTASFQVTAKGSGGLSYQWLLNGSAIAGATASSYNLPVSLVDHGKRFSVTVTSPYGSTTSDEALLNVTASLPAPPKDMTTLSAKVGDPLRAMVSPGGTPPFSYQWQRSNDGGASWRDVAGATEMNFTVAQATLAWTQVQLRVQVSNSVGTVASAPVLFKVSPNVRILAGSTGGAAYADGVGAEARFNAPHALAIDRDGSILVADYFRCVIRRVQLDGKTSLAAGKGSCGLYISSADMQSPSDLAVNSDGRIFYSTSNGIFYVTAEGQFERFSAVLNAKALTFDTDDTLLALDSNGYQLFRIDRTGKPSSLLDLATSVEHLQNIGQIQVIALDAKRNIFIAGRSSIWRLDAITGQLSRWAGNGSNTSSCRREGTRLDVCVRGVWGMRFDDQGNLVFLSGDAMAMRIDAASGQVAWMSGLGATLSNDMDGPARVAAFPSSSYTTLLWHSSGQFIFSNYNGSIRTIARDGAVATLAGKPTYVGSLTAFGKGEQAQFAPGQLSNDPTGFALMAKPYIYGVLQIDAAGNVGSSSLKVPTSAYAWVQRADGWIYYLKQEDFSVRKLYLVAPTGYTEDIAGGESTPANGCRESRGTGVSFGRPTVITMDGLDNLLIADSGCQRIWQWQRGALNIRKLASIGTEIVTAFAKDSQNNVYFAQQSKGIFKLGTDGSVTLVPGGDSPLLAAVTSIAFDDEGNLYATDPEAAKVYRLGPTGYLTTVMGNGIQALRPGVDGAIGKPQSIIVTSGNRLLFTSENAVVTD